MLALLKIAERQLIRNEHGLQSLQAFITNSYATEIKTKEVDAVKKSWKSLQKNSQKLSKEFFSALFKKYPDYAKLFKRYGDCPEDLLCNDAFIKDHGVGNVLVNIGKIISKLDDPCEAELFAREVGKKHIKFCMKGEQFKNARPVFVKTIQTISCDLEEDAKKGWDKTSKIIFGGLERGLKA